MQMEERNLGWVGRRDSGRRLFGCGIREIPRIHFCGGLRIVNTKHGQQSGTPGEHVHNVVTHQSV